MDTLKGKIVFITGAAGFFGANLSRDLLRRGVRLHGLVKPSSSLWRLDDLRSEITLHKSNLNDQSRLEGIIRSINPDIVVHSAFPAGNPIDRRSRRDMIETGLIGTTNLLEALLENEPECVFSFGSSMEYGPKDTPMSEVDALEPVSFRGAVKAAQTLICRQYAERFQLPIAVLRPFMVYGPWEAPPRFIPAIILATLRGEPIQLTPPGFRRDYLFVEDLVEASIRTCQADLDGFEILNIGSGNEHTNEEVAATVEKIAGRVLDLQPGTHPLRPWDRAHWLADITKTERVLGWRPRHTLEQGLEKTYAWFQQHHHLYTTYTPNADLDEPPADRAQRRYG